MNEIPTFSAAPPVPPPSYVRAGEEMVWLGRPTLALLVSQTVGLITSFLFLSLFFFGIAGSSNEVGFAFLPVVVLVAFIVLLVLQSMRLRRTQYVVTRQSIYTRIGLVGQTVIQTTFDKITDISLKQDIIGRILGFSSLNVNTAGSGTPPVKMDGLRNALEIKSLIEAARENFLRRPERSAPAPRRNLPKFIPDRLLARMTCPTTKRVFKRPRTELGTKVPCPMCNKHHVFKEAPGGRPGTA